MRRLRLSSTLLRTLSLLVYSIYSCMTFAEYDCIDPDTYVQLPSLPQTVGEVASAIIDDKLYLVGQVNEETYQYSLTFNTWSTVKDRIYKGNHHGSFTFDNEWWLIGGIDADSYDKIQIYNPESDEWREHFPSLPFESGSPCVAVINAVIYVCGGVSNFHTKRGKVIPQGKSTIDSCVKYDTEHGNKQWQTIPSMTYGRNHAAVASDNQRRLWVFGGRIGKNARGNGYDTVQIYDTMNEKWMSSLVRMPFGRGGMGNAIYYQGKMYIFGGETLDNPNGFANENMTYDIVSIYDIESDEWSRGSNMLYARHGLFPVLHKNAVYMAGGGESNGYSSCNKFTKYCLDKDVKAENRWIQIGDMTTFGGDDTASPSVLMYAVLVIMAFGVFVVYMKWNRKQKKIKLSDDILFENVPFLSERAVLRERN